MNRDVYFRVGPRIWDEPWTDDARYAAFYILTCRHRRTEGLYRLPVSYATEDLGWTARRFRTALNELTGHGFVEYDWDAKVILIVRALSWQQIQNPNQVLAARKALRALPPTGLLSRLHEIAATHCERLAEGLAEEFPELLAEQLPELLPQRFAEPLNSKLQAPSPTSSTAGGGMSESGNGEPPPGFLRSIEGGTT